MSKPKSTKSNIQSSTPGSDSAVTGSAKKKRVNVSLAHSFNDLLDDNGKGVFLNQSLLPDDPLLCTDPVEASIGLVAIIKQKIAAFESELSGSFKFRCVVVGKSGSDIGDVSQLTEGEFTQHGNCKSIYSRWKGYRMSHVAKTKVALEPDKKEKKYAAKLKTYNSTVSKNIKEMKRAADNTPPPVCMMVIATMGPHSMPDHFFDTGLQHEDYGELIESILQALLQKQDLHHLKAGLGGGGQRCLAEYIVIYICIYADDLRTPTTDNSSTDNLTNACGEDESDDEDEVEESDEDDEDDDADEEIVVV